jgi:hypothetical protein
MNVFEMGMIAAPTAGMLSGVRAAAGHGPAVTIAGAFGGLVIGAAAYFGPVLLSGSLWNRARHVSEPPRELTSALEWVAGTVVVLSATASPFVAWLLSGLAVARLIEVTG